MVHMEFKLHNATLAFSTGNIVNRSLTNLLVGAGLPLGFFPPFLHTTFLAIKKTGLRISEVQCLPSAGRTNPTHAEEMCQNSCFSEGRNLRLQLKYS